jgi:D-threo-aldose 1-dehydrogenase
MTGAATPAPSLEQRYLRPGRQSLSVLGFGAAAIGNLYTETTDEVAHAAVECALDSGIRYFDTAPSYGFGLSETRLGRALAGIPRTAFTLSTKVGRWIEADSTATARINAGFAVSGMRALFDYTRDGVRRSFESSLSRLKVGRIDILLLHDVGRLTHGDRHDEMLRLALDEALPAMADLRAAGLVDSIGIGVNEARACLEVMHRFDLDCIMLAGRYTLLEQREGVQVLDEAQRRGVKVIAAAPYNSGLLANAAGPGATYNYDVVGDTAREHARRIYAACAAGGVDVGAAALQLPLAHPDVVSVVAGLRTSHEVQTAVGRMKAPIPSTLWERLRREDLLDPRAPVPSRPV